MAVESAWLRDVDQRRRAWLAYLADTSELLGQSLRRDGEVAQRASHGGHGMVHEHRQRHHASLRRQSGHVLYRSPAGESSVSRTQRRC